MFNIAASISTVSQKLKFLLLTDTKPLEELKNWLFSNVLPWEGVVEKWNKTRVLRRDELRAGKSSLVASFVKEWPILKHPDAYVLINEDFQSMNLTDVCLNFKIWNRFFEDLVSLYPVDPRHETAAGLFGLLEIKDLDEGNLLQLLAVFKLMKIFST